MRIVVIGDLHGDAVTYGEPRFEEVERAIWAAYEAARKLKADHFISLGDVANPGPRSHRVVALCAEIAARAAGSGGFGTCWLVGNHDVLEDGSGDHVLMPLATAGFRVWAEPIAESLRSLDCRGKNDVGVIALPHASRARAYDPAAFVERTAATGFPARVVFGHLSIPGVAGGSESADMARGRQMLWPLAALKQHYPEAILIGGHVHAPGDYAGVHVVGAVARFTSAEADCRPSYSILEIDTDGAQVAEKAG